MISDQEWEKRFLNRATDRGLTLEHAHMLFESNVLLDWRDAYDDRPEDAVDNQLEG